VVCALYLCRIPPGSLWAGFSMSAVAPSGLTAWLRSATRAERPPWPHARPLEEDQIDGPYAARDLRCPGVITTREPGEDSWLYQLADFADWSVCSRPVVAEVGIREIMGPAVKDPGQGGSLPASCWQVPLQNEHQDYVALSSEVCHGFGDHGPALRPGGCGDLRVISRPQAHLANVHRISAMGIAQYFSSGCRKHLIDKERCHARSASRCRAVMRLCSAMSRLRSMRSLISSACSEA
jgi:hypothetical protein